MTREWLVTVVRVNTHCTARVWWTPSAQDAPVPDPRYPSGRAFVLPLEAVEPATTDPRTFREGDQWWVTFKSDGERIMRARRATTPDALRSHQQTR